MPDFYLLAPYVDKIPVDANVYLVECSNSKRSCETFLRIARYAEQSKWFFKLKNRWTENLLKSMYPADHQTQHHICYNQKLIHCNMIDLWRAISNGMLGTVDNPANVTARHEDFRNSYNPVKFVRERSDRNNPIVLTYSRNNLSPQSACSVCDRICAYVTKCPAYHLAAYTERFTLNNNSGKIQITNILK